MFRTFAYVTLLVVGGFITVLASSGGASAGGWDNDPSLWSNLVGSSSASSWEDDAAALTGGFEAAQSALGGVTLNSLAGTAAGAIAFDDGDAASGSTSGTLAHLVPDGDTLKGALSAFGGSSSITTNGGLTGALNAAASQAGDIATSVVGGTAAFTSGGGASASSDALGAVTALLGH